MKNCTELRQLNIWFCNCDWTSKKGYPFLIVSYRHNYGYIRGHCNTFCRTELLVLSVFIIWLPKYYKTGLLIMILRFEASVHGHFLWITALVFVKLRIFGSAPGSFLEHWVELVILCRHKNYGHHFVKHIFKTHFFNGSWCFSIQIPLKCDLWVQMTISQHWLG